MRCSRSASLARTRLAPRDMKCHGTFGVHPKGTAATRTAATRMAEDDGVDVVASAKVEVDPEWSKQILSIEDLKARKVDAKLQSANPKNGVDFKGRQLPDQHRQRTDGPQPAPHVHRRGRKRRSCRARCSRSGRTKRRRPASSQGPSASASSPLRPTRRPTTSTRPTARSPTEAED